MPRLEHPLWKEERSFVKSVLRGHCLLPDVGEATALKRPWEIKGSAVLLRQSGGQWSGAPV